MNERVQNWPRRCSEERWQLLAGASKRVGEYGGIAAARAAILGSLPRARSVVGIEDFDFHEGGLSFLWFVELNDGVWVYDGFHGGSLRRWKLDALNWVPVRRRLEEARPWRFDSVGECSELGGFGLGAIYVYVYLDGEYSQFAYLRVWRRSRAPLEPGDEPNPADDEYMLIEMVQGLTKWKI